MNLNPDEVKQITASESMYSSYLYVIEDKEGIDAIVELCNSLRFVPTDELSFSDLLGDTLYSLIFSRDASSTEAEGTLAGIHISSQGYVYYMDYAQMYEEDLPVCRLMSQFDEERLKSLLKEYDAFAQDEDNVSLSELSTESAWETK
jgi:hypothetical protein